MIESRQTNFDNVNFLPGDIKQALGISGQRQLNSEDLFEAKKRN
jgi:hypothetical protein